MIIKTSNDTLLEKESNSNGWYVCNKDYVYSIIEVDKNLLAFTQNNSHKYFENAIKNKCKDMKHNVINAVNISKERWTRHLANTIQRINMSPREVQNTIEILKRVLTSHFNDTSNEPKMRTSGGSLTSDCKRIVKSFFVIFPKSVQLRHKCRHCVHYAKS